MAALSVRFNTHHNAATHQEIYLHNGYKIQFITVKLYKNVYLQKQKVKLHMYHTLA